MASSKVMSSTSPSNPDLQRHHHHASIHSLSSDDDPTRNLGSMNMDDFLKSIYSDTDSFPPPSAAVDDGVPDSKNNRAIDEVWKEMVSGGVAGNSNRQPEMTLEDFLTKAGAVREEDVRATPADIPAPMTMSGAEMTQFSHMQNGMGVFGVEPPVGFDGRMVGVGITGGGGGRGKRRAVEEAPVDKATQQKQKRMIKNRESAARSRERKQAYTVELESLVTQLEEENARLLREEAEQAKERFNQLMEKVIPVVEKRRPPRVIRRVNSMHW